MEIRSYSEVSDSRRVFEIEIPTEEVDKARAESRRNYARRATLPGFRKGRSRIGRRAEIRRRDPRRTSRESNSRTPSAHAIAEKGIQPIGRPRIEDLTCREGSRLAFRANVDIRPSIDPGEYAGLHLTDVDVEPRKRRKSTRFARAHPRFARGVPSHRGRAARDGDYAIVDVADRFVEVESPILYTADGSTIADEKSGEWHRDEKVTLEVGHPDSMPEINDALRGASPGDAPVPEDLPRLSEREIRREDGGLRKSTLVAR